MILCNLVLYPTSLVFKAFLMAVIFHLRSYGNLSNHSQRDYFCKLYIYIYILAQAPRSEPPGQGKGAGQTPSELPTLLPPPSWHPSPPFFLSWNQLPSLPAHPCCPTTSINNKSLLGAQASARHLREQGLACLQGPCSLCGKGNYMQEGPGGWCPEGQCSEKQKGWSGGSSAP